MQVITEVEVDSVYEAEDIGKIFKLLVDKGALKGVRGGSTNIHWDLQGNFMGIKFDYWVYKEGA